MSFACSLNRMVGLGQTNRNRQPGTARPKLLRIALIGLIAAAALGIVLVGQSKRRGMKAWEQCKLELEARGERLDWTAFIPGPLPDEKNFLKAPGMMAQFSRRSSQTNQDAMFELPSWATKLPFTLDDLRALPEGDGSVESPGEHLVCSRFRLRNWFARLNPEYHLLLQASMRPACRLGGDYRDPMSIDLPNFINARKVAQGLATQASLNLFDGKSDDAIQNMALLRRTADVAISNPTVVGAMIRVAIFGLYLQVARDAIESGTLSDAQLKSIQENMRDITLVQDLADAVRVERATEAHLLTLPAAQLLRLIPQLNGAASQTQNAWAFWRFDWNNWIGNLRLRYRFRSPHLRAQTMASLCRFYQEILDAAGRTNRPIKAIALEQTFSRGPQGLGGSEARLAALFIPNLARAFMVAARVQTQLNQLQMACALERYRVAHQCYPDQCDALLPAFLDAIPTDLLGGRPLQYRRLGDKNYELWSVGWNETDDGAKVNLNLNGKPTQDDKKGDWVWLGRSKNE